VGSRTLQLTLYHLSNLGLEVLKVEWGQEAQGAQMERHDRRHAALWVRRWSHGISLSTKKPPSSQELQTLGRGPDLWSSALLGRLVPLFPRWALCV
jgi:hypothetical protein